MSLNVILECLASSSGESYVSRQKEIDLFKQLTLSSPKDLFDVVSKITADAPMDVEPNTVGEYLYGCVIGQSSAPVGCTPSCIDGYVLPESKGCTYFVYRRFDNKTTQIKRGKESTAYLFIPFGDSSDLRREEISLFNDEHIKHVSVYQYPEKGINYEHLIDHNIKKMQLKDKMAKNSDTSPKSTSDTKTSSKDTSDTNTSSTSDTNTSIKGTSDINTSTKGTSDTNTSTKGTEETSTNVTSTKSTSDTQSRKLKVKKSSGRNKKSLELSVNPRKMNRKMRSDSSSDQDRSSKSNSSSDESRKSKSSESKKSNSSSDESRKSKSADISEDNKNVSNFECPNTPINNTNDKRKSSWLCGLVVAILTFIVIIVIAYLIYRSGWLTNVESKKALLIQPDHVLKK